MTSLPATTTRELPPASDERRYLPALLGALAFSNLTAYARDGIIAAVFGASARTDAYFVGAFLPTLLATILVFESLVPALLPMLSRAAGDRRASRGLLGSALLLVAGLLGGTALAVALAAEPVIRLLAHDWPAAEVGMAASLLRITGLSLLPLGAGAVLAAALSARERYLAPPLGLACSNAVVIAATLLFGGRLGIAAPAWGLVAGSLVYLAIQLWAVRRATASEIRGQLPRPRPEPGSFRSGNSHFPAVARAMLPMLLFACLAQNVAVMERWLGSSLPAGQISHLVYAGKLMMSPLLVITAAGGLVAFVAMNRAGAVHDIAAFRVSLTRSARLLTILLSMASLALIVLGRPLIQLALQHGRFGVHDAAITTVLLAIYALGLVPNGLSWLLYRSLQSRACYWEALRTMLAATLIYAGCAVGLFTLWGVRGVAAAFPIGQIASLLLLYGQQPPYLRLAARGTADFAARLGLLLALTGVALAGLRLAAAGLLGDGLAAAGLTLLAGGGVILVSLSLGMQLLGVPEGALFLHWLRTAAGRPRRWLAARA